MVLKSVSPILAGLKSLAGEFAYGYDAKSPALLTKMTGPVHEVAPYYPPSPRGLRSFGERSAVGGGQKAVGGRQEAVDGGQKAVEEADSVRYYTRGRDLSGSLQGAGGVGGLLAISKVNPNADKPGEAQLQTLNLKIETLFPTYDANGNIGQLINADANVVAAYAYDPFGNVTEMAGAEAVENPWRFSTKPVESGTGWLYYGYRWYDVENGRWPSRDPIEERGGVNLYGFVGNDGVERWDFLGLDVQWKEDEFTMVARWTMNDGIKSLGVSAVGISFPLGASAEFSLTGRREGDITISQSSGKQPGEVVLPDGCVWCGPPVLVSANISEPTVTLRYKNQWMFVTFWDTSTSYKATARIKWKMQYKC